MSMLLPMPVLATINQVLMYIRCYFYNNRSMYFDLAIVNIHVSLLLNADIKQLRL